MRGRLDARRTLKSLVADLRVQYVVVTKAGTFVQVDWDGYIEGNGEWAWLSALDQIFSYRFLDDEEDNGIVQVAFDNDRASFIESFEEYDDDYGQYVTFVSRINAVAR